MIHNPNRIFGRFKNKKSNFICFYKYVFDAPYLKFTKVAKNKKELCYPFKENKSILELPVS